MVICGYWWLLMAIEYLWTIYIRFIDGLYTNQLKPTSYHTGQCGNPLVPTTNRLIDQSTNRPTDQSTNRLIDQSTTNNRQKHWINKCMLGGRAGGRTGQAFVDSVFLPFVCGRFVDESIGRLVDWLLEATGVHTTWCWTMLVSTGSFIIMLIHLSSSPRVVQSKRPKTGLGVGFG